MATIPDSATKGDPNDKLVIIGLQSIGSTISSGSPYVSKVETFCRLNEIPYEAERPRGMKGSPKDTLPYIKHGEVVLADSEFILDYLTNTYDVKVKPSEDRKLRGTAVAVKRLCEDHLYYGLLYYRWATPGGFQLVQDNYFKGLPIPLRWFIPGQLRKKVLETLHKQGTGRHSFADIGKLVDSSLSAVSDILGENKFIIGDSPCPEDASLFATLDNCLHPEVEGVPAPEMIKKYPNLVAYVENMKNLYYPDDNPSKFANLA
ncbi:hypothetical protein BSKO_08959 [Bryopsis sp. KO-2023]|nr:hypothetical protein BSKO_08959 [Bryopsis sp. KO-2023]